MRRWVMVGLLLVVGLVIGGMIVAGIQRQRLMADREGCKFRFEQLGQFAAEYTKGTAGLNAGEPLPPEVPQLIPPGTVPNLKLPPNERLSWVCTLLPLLDQNTQETKHLAELLDLSRAWDAGTNRDVANTPLKLLLCPGALPDMTEGQPAPTQFVGLSGLGPDSAELPLSPPLSPRAGGFRYDTPTPLTLLRANDGLSTTFLFAETANELGPWARGGFSTVRGLDVGEKAKPPLGRGGQFGGNYPGVAVFGRADGSATFVRTAVSPEVLRSHFTIAGGEGGVPGE
jgi:hypothetical protein